MKIFSVRTTASVLVAINAFTAYELMAIDGHMNHLEILSTRQTDIAMQTALENDRAKGHPHIMVEHQVAATAHEEATRFALEHPEAYSLIEHKGK